MSHIRTPLIVLPILLLVGCTISEKQEIQMGRESHAKFEQQFGGLYRDQHVQQYVNAVGRNMARYAGRPNLQWQFAVVNSDSINAFAVPGGYVYITRGLLFQLRNEAQLAGILGHESAHIAHRHSVRQIEKARFAQGSTAVVGVVGSVFGVGGVGSAANIVASLALMNYSRDQEKEADMSGMKYMTSYGYNPLGMVQAMTILQQASRKGGKAPEFLSTHPNPGNRIEYLTREIETKYPAHAHSGIFGGANFQQHVLSRGKIAIGVISLADPTTWCVMCRNE